VTHIQLRLPIPTLEQSSLDLNLSMFIVHIAYVRGLQHVARTPHVIRPIMLSIQRENNDKFYQDRDGITSLTATASGVRARCRLSIHI